MLEELFRAVETAPESTNAELAKHFSVSEGWISVIRHSDGFKHALRERAKRAAGGDSALPRAPFVKGPENA